MKDHAREHGVSVVTVSKVPRNHEDIGEATRKRVVDRVKELDFREPAQGGSIAGEIVNP